MATRGMRNNNPGNIRKGLNWLGLADKQTDPAFCQFKSMEYGVRAIGKLLMTYQSKHGLRTIRGMINRWAPPQDHNDTTAYVNYVCRQLMVKPDDVINIKDEGTMEIVVSAIIHVENGYGLQSEIVKKGVKMALGK